MRAFALVPGFVLITLCPREARPDPCAPADAELLVDALVEVGGLGDAVDLDGSALDETALREAASAAGCDYVDGLQETLDELEYLRWSRGAGAADGAEASDLDEWWRWLLPRVELRVRARWGAGETLDGATSRWGRAGIELWFLWFVGPRG